MFRKTVSLTLVISLLLLTISSAVLYIQPEGRVAFWTNWTFLALSKTAWGNIHITGGILFLVTCFLHTALNYKAILSYISLKKSGYGAILCSVLICMLVYIGTAGNITPFNILPNTSHSIKAWQEKKLGTPPYGHAETSTIKKFCKLTGWPVEGVLENLKKSGMQNPDGEKATLKEIAQKNNTSPAKVFEAMGKNLPPLQTMKSGMGRKNKE